MNIITNKKKKSHELCQKIIQVQNINKIGLQIGYKEVKSWLKVDLVDM